MKLKWLVFFGCLLLFAESCKKEAGNKNLSNDNPPAVINTSPPPGKTLIINSAFQSNMVVQRDKPLVIWGQATAGYNINVDVSWNATAFTTIADQNGDWKISIPASPANATPQTITCKTDGLDPIVFTNVLIGDVWICSGQSNMVMEVGNISPFLGVTNFTQEIASANYPLIRAQTIQEDHQSYPLNNFTYNSTWQICSPATAGNISGVAYFFAQKLFTSLNVPIGIIVSAVNGTSCSQWSNNGDLYNGMISPLTQLSIKGFVWYQGENDEHVTPASSYTSQNDALIQYWRSAFNQGSLPFYYVQMTPFAEDYYNTTPVGGDMVTDWFAKFREAQANIRLIANTGMAVTMDVGEPANHHPQNKKPVGERLALLALRNTYNINVQCVGPQYSSYTQSGNTLTINFVSGTADGLTTINNAVLKQYFFVAGTDHVFTQCAATINGNAIVLTIPTGIPLPVQAIRYAFTSAPVTNLQNSAGLPAEPFRTDNW
jgi:sialate O-acetylesterase